MDLRSMLLAVAVSCFLASTIVSAHGGGLGCHHNRNAGGYHSHRGPLADQHFDSKQAVLKRLQGDSSRRNHSKRKLRRNSRDQLEWSKLSGR
jgi:hypothetical protein